MKYRYGFMKINANNLVPAGIVQRCYVDSDNKPYWFATAESRDIELTANRERFPGCQWITMELTSYLYNEVGPEVKMVYSKNGMVKE